MGWFSTQPSPLDLEITRVTEALNVYEIGSEDYLRVLEMVKELRELRDKSAQVATLREIAQDLRSIKYSVGVLETRSNEEVRASRV